MKPRLVVSPHRSPLVCGNGYCTPKRAQRCSMAKYIFPAGSGPSGPWRLLGSSVYDQRLTIVRSTMRHPIAKVGHCISSFPNDPKGKKEATEEKEENKRKDILWGPWPPLLRPSSLPPPSASPSTCGGIATTCTSKEGQCRSCHPLIGAALGALGYFHSPRAPISFHTSLLYGFQASHFKNRRCRDYLPLRRTAGTFPTPTYESCCRSDRLSLHVLKGAGGID